MKPEVGKLLEIISGKLLFEVAPSLQPAYRQQSVGLTAMLLGMVREEWDRAAARRVEENAALRALFGRAAPRIADPELRSRLEAAAASSEPSLLVSALEKSNDALRALLIELHAHVEAESAPWARGVEDEIWKELVTSTERRRFSLAPF
ncbi:MAG TPA: hypothetical protein VEI82_05560 [Myxococcota bacterium]|nr:hypothetical protein [Myxococcota bacterium]